MINACRGKTFKSVCFYGIMDCLDVIAEGMAGANIDMVIGMLSNSVKKSPEELRMSAREYCRKLNNLSISVHSLVWKGSATINQVKDEIIPLLQSAYEKTTFRGKYFNDLRAGMKWRRELAQMYCNRLGPCLPDWVVEKISN